MRRISRMNPMFVILRPMRLFLASLAILAALAGPAAAKDLRSKDTALFSQAALTERVSVLAADDMEGRGTGQEGIDRAAEYLAAEMEKIGVSPAGDDGTYYQNFTLKRWKRIGDKTRLRVGFDGSPPAERLAIDDDFRPFPFSDSGAFNAGVVFVGYGLSSREYEYDDYRDADVKGKVVLMLRRAPRFEEFSRMEMAFRAKASAAKDHGAAAVLVVNPTFDDDGDALFAFDAAGGGGPASYGIPMIHLRRATAERLLESGGLPDLATIEARIDEGRAPYSRVLKGVSIRGRVDLETEERPVRNIVGLVPGRGPDAEEFIVLGAHYDHLGVRNKDRDSFDPEKDISNGADDNASGTALVLTLAEAFLNGKPPNRSLLLVLFTGEEMGLLGSKHFVDNPTVDLDRVIAMLNFDMVGRLRNDTLDVGGAKTGGFQDMIRKLAETHGLSLKDGGGGRGPSDHTSFYNKDIPVMFFFTGLHKEYHQPTDDVPLVNFDGAMKIARFVTDVIDEIDAADSPPAFARDNRGPNFARRDRQRRAPRADAPEAGETAAPADAKAASDDMARARELLRAYALWVEQRERVFGAQVEARVDREDRQITLVIEGIDADQYPRICDEVYDLVRRLTDGGAMDISTSLKRGAGDGAESRIEMRLSPAGQPNIAQSPPEMPAPRVRPKARAAAKVASKKADKDPHADPHAGAHGDDGNDDVTATPMPAVRLGIMPSYGETEGEGYEITGVVEDGPAAKAGMKDDDRIYKIGDALVTDVYSYMDALRKFKPGDVVEVTVIRGEKKVVLKIKTEATKSREAA